MMVAFFYEEKNKSGGQIWEHQRGAYDWLLILYRTCWTQLNLFSVIQGYKIIAVSWNAEMSLRFIEVNRTACPDRKSLQATAILSI